MNKRAIRFILFGLVVLPFIFLASYSYYASYQDQTEATKARRLTLAQLSAVILTEKFDRMADVGISLASRISFQNMIRRGQWSLAIDRLRQVFRDFSYIDQIILIDIYGTRMASLPEIPGSVGENLSFTDWYRGVISKKEPFISGIYTRPEVPRYDVVALAVPVRSDDGQILAVLMLQIKARTLSDWIQSVAVGQAGTVYFVDQKGTAVRYRNFYDQNPASDYSDFPPVKKMKRGKSGADFFIDPFEKKLSLVAYMPVTAYGWGVLVTQPVSEAFELRDKSQNSLLAVYAFLLFLNILLVSVIWRGQNRLIAREKEIAFVSAEREQLELFAFVASHDLQEPLQKIMGFETLLRDRYSQVLGEEGCRHLERIDKSAKQMMHMMEDIRQFSRVRKAGKLVKIDLGEIVREVISDFQEKLTEIGAHVQVERLPQIEGYPAQLAHLFHNLIGNAIKFRKADRQLAVFIDCKPSGKDHCKIRVRDNGIGFDEQYLDLIFTPFKRLHNKSEYEGSGMGLAICKKIAIFHGGNITAKSSVDEGTTFILSLPCKII